MDQNELPLEPRHLGVPSGASKTIIVPMVHLVQAVQHRLQTDQNKIWHDLHHLGLPSGASKMISEPIVRSA
jgi:hypothetical protein